MGKGRPSNDLKPKGSAKSKKIEKETPHLDNTFSMRKGKTGK